MHSTFIGIQVFMLSAITNPAVNILVRVFGVHQNTFGCIYVGYVGEGNGTPLQYSCLENPMDGGAWWAAVFRVTESDTNEVTQQHVGYVVRSGFTRSESAYFGFSRVCQTMSQGGCTNKLLLKAYESFHCSTSLSTLQALVVFISKFAIVMGMQSSLILFLICDSQMTNVVFIDSMAVWISSWDVPGQDFRQFYKLNVLFPIDL